VTVRGYPTPCFSPSTPSPSRSRRLSEEVVIGPRKNGFRAPLWLSTGPHCHHIARLMKIRRFYRTGDRQTGPASSNPSLVPAYPVTLQLPDRWTIVGAGGEQRRRGYRPRRADRRDRVLWFGRSGRGSDSVPSRVARR